jgi:pilus assembly protein Flp/PilA
MMLKTQMFIHSLMTKLVNPLANKQGATAVEYGIMVALIAVAVIVTVGILGNKLDAVFANVTNKLP